MPAGEPHRKLHLLFRKGRSSVTTFQSSAQSQTVEVSTIDVSLHRFPLDCLMPSSALRLGSLAVTGQLLCEFELLAIEGYAG